MKRKFWKQFVRHAFFACTLIIGCLWAVSCKDEYEYDNKEPDWLGASIYDYLKADGNYTYYVKLIDQLEYAPVLSKTGSKTIFVANDDAFNRFFDNNIWGVKRYDDLSTAQKKILLFYSIINNSYLIETLSNYNLNDELVEGSAMRRTTSVSVYDTIPFLKGDQLPNGSKTYNFWAPYKDKGIYILKDQTPWPIAYFLERQMSLVNLTDEDFTLITSLTRKFNDAHIFKNKVLSRDITCKNGYINIMEDVLVPPQNMADYIESNPNTTIFSALLQRFSAPYYYAAGTNEFRNQHPGSTDSVFVKAFFNNSSNDTKTRLYYASNHTTYTPKGAEIPDALLLPINPEWNSYSNGSDPLQGDFATMFVPTDAAMTTYFNEGTGKILKERFGSWDNVPDDVIAKLLRRHMRKSFIQSLPSRFETMTDQESNPLPAKISEIDGTYLGLNGLVYLYKNVFSPIDYVSVISPVTLGSKTNIFKYIIEYGEKTNYRIYLNSIENTFSLFVPTDDFFDHYIDPVTISKNIPGALKFKYNSSTKKVYAVIYKYDKYNNQLGDSVGNTTNVTFVVNRLYDVLNMHIVIDNVESGKKFYLTKNGNVLQIEGKGSGLKVKGGGNIEIGTQCNTVDYFPQLNGNTYFIDKPLLAPLRSVYYTLKNTPQFSYFFDLMNGFTPAKTIASTKMFVGSNIKGYYGIDYNIKFLNSYNYTVYVPTNEAIMEAFTAGIIAPWNNLDGITGINQMDTVSEMAAIAKLERFIRYHFQDGSVFLGNEVSARYSSATIKLESDTITASAFNTIPNKYFKLLVTTSSNDITINTEASGTAKVVTTDGLYNILARDYIFNKDPGSFKEIDGLTGSGDAYITSNIETSSTAVLHQIDHVLLFQ